MNVLPLVLLVLVVISIMGIEKLQKHKNSALTQHEHVNYVNNMERTAFNQRQFRLAKVWERDHRILSFRIFLNKKTREKKGAEVEAQMKFLFKELIKQLYGHTQFYQKLESKRPACWDEMLDCIMRASDKRAKTYPVNRIEKMATLHLEDDELQFVFYRMLKGTIQWNERFNAGLTTHSNADRAYPSLLLYLNFNGAEEGDMRIRVDQAPIELLRAIFEDEATVRKMIELRMDDAFKKQNDAKTFAEMFSGKQKKEISLELLNFSLSQQDREEYN